MSLSATKRVEELGLLLPGAGGGAGYYGTRYGKMKPHYLSDKLLFLSGQTAGVDGEGKALFPGRLGRDVTVEQGYEAARLTGLNCLSCIKDAVGDLDRVKRVVKLVGFVNSSPDFTDQPKVVNGCSDLFVEVFGDAGRHARSAVGVAQLPFNVSVEVEAVIEFA